jgi:hypothetical protein
MGRSAQVRGTGVLLLPRLDPTNLRQNGTQMSLRGGPIEQDVTLPDGRVVAVRVGLAEDSYIPRRELDTVVLELWDEERGEHLAGVTTVLSADDVDAARALVREVVAGLGDGSLAPTAGALGPLADSVPPE